MKFYVRLLLLFLVLLVASLPAAVFATPTPTASAQPAHSSPRYQAGELVIKLRAGYRFAADLPIVALAHDQTGQQTGQQTTDTADTADTADLPNAAAVQQVNTLLETIDAYQAAPVLADTYHVHFRSTTDAARLAASLRAHPAVAYAEPNYERHSMRTPNDPLVVEQWALTNIQAFEAWDTTTGGAIVVAVLDTGVAAGHPDLEGKVLPGFNAMSQTDNAEDDNGHGTAVSGLIAARTDNGRGIAGMCWECQILPIKVLNSRGSGNDVAVARGIRWATDQGARIINMSLGGSDDSQLLHDAVLYAYERGALVVAASGNERQQGNAITYPSGYEEVVAVGGTSNSDQVTGFSNTGDHLDIAAPSVGLWTTIAGGDRLYGPPNGTSFSSPYVAGAAALVWTLRPDLSNLDVKCVLEASADDKGAPGKDSEYGWGRLNALGAVQLAQNYNGCPLAEPAPQAPAPPEPQPGPGDSDPFAPTAPPEGQPDVTYFPETQHTLRNEFKRYWEAQGGLPIFGYPISEEFVEMGSDGNAYLVQYFQRHRFEFHPNEPPPYNVQLSRLGDMVLEAQGRSWFTFPAGVPNPDCLFFEATSHTLCGPFLTYWQNNGLEFDGQPGTSYAESLALFGQPLSEPQVEEVAPGVQVTVQWFERARFEDHGADGVLLGLLSDDLTRLQGRR